MLCPNGVDLSAADGLRPGQPFRVPTAFKMASIGTLVAQGAPRHLHALADGVLRQFFRRDEEVPGRDLTRWAEVRMQLSASVGAYAGLQGCAERHLEGPGRATIMQDVGNPKFLGRDYARFPGTADACTGCEDSAPRDFELRVLEGRVNFRVPNTLRGRRHCRLRHSGSSGRGRCSRRRRWRRDGAPALHILQ